MIVEAHKVRKSRTVDFFQRFCLTENTPVAMSVMLIRYECGDAASALSLVGLFWRRLRARARTNAGHA